VGDFDANGHDDILWRNDNGTVSVWNNGHLAGAPLIAGVGTIAGNGWNFASVGDYDHNGRSDILWRNDTGAMSIWDNGQIAGAHIIVSGGIPSDWHVA
jgi:hypothetical protein